MASTIAGSPGHEEQQNLEQNPLPLSPYGFQCHQPQPSETLTLALPQNEQENQPIISEDQKQYDTDEVTEVHQSIDDPQVTSSLYAAVRSFGSVHRRGSKRKKIEKRMETQRKKNRKKLETLTVNFNPIPFVPAKTLDFSKHEKLLRRLGLWDFVHIEFDRQIHSDLIVQLVGNYCKSNRDSYVNGVRVLVNRADLARALKLPQPKKEKGVVMVESVEEGPETEESIGFVVELVSNWMLLQEDMWMMPDEVLNWMKIIKAGLFEKVEWASLIWFMVEKELAQDPSALFNCYYASHLQWVIRSQKVGLLQEAEKPMVVADDKEVDGKEEENESDDDVTMIEANELQQLDLDEDKIELTLGQENVEKDDDEKEQFGEENVMDLEECKGSEPDQWQLDQKDNASEHFLRPCNHDIAGSVSEEHKKQDEEKEEVAEEEIAEEEEDEEIEVGEEEEEVAIEEEIEEVVAEEHGEEEDELQQQDQERGFHFSPNGLSENFIQGLETAEIPFTSGLQLHDRASGEFLSSRGERHIIPGGSSFFGIESKREIDDDEHYLSHHALDSGNKRLKSYGSFSNKSAAYETCMEEIQHLVGKATLIYKEKERAHDESNMNQQILLNEVQQRDQIIDHLEKSKYEEKRRSDAEVYRLENELYMMANLLENYRKAIKETHKAFAEYRARYPQPEEPVYKDVPGSNGLVLSTTELEKLELKREQERTIHLMIEKMIKDFEAGWRSTFDGHEAQVEMLCSRLLGNEKQISMLKESFAKVKVLKVSEQPENAPNE